MNKFITAFFFIIFLASCGGGSSESSKTPNLKLAKNILYFQDYVLGVSAETAIVTFTIENQTGSLFVVAKNNNPELVDKIYVSSSSLTVYPARPSTSNLNPGTYQGSITVMLCKDSECKNPISGSEKSINIAYDVLENPG